MRRALVAAACILGAWSASATAATTLNVIPHGQFEPGVPWAGAPGLLPAETQANMYNRLTPLFRDVTDAQLQPSTDGTGYYKSSAFLDQNDPSFVASEVVSGIVAERRPGHRDDQARQLRRAAHLLRHRRRRRLRRRARRGRGPQPAHRPGALQRRRRPDRHARRAGHPARPRALQLQAQQAGRRRGHAPSRTRRSPPRAPTASGCSTTSTPTSRASTRGTPSTSPRRRRSPAPTSTRSTRSRRSSSARAAATRSPTPTSSTGCATSSAPSAATQAFEDLRGRNDPETATTTTKKFPWQTDVSVAKPKGVVNLVNGSFRSTGPTLPGTTGARAQAASVDHPHGPEQKASNILIASGKRSNNGSPLFVGGPQIGYNYPGLTLEMAEYGPAHPRPRRHVGAVPRLHAHRPRGERRLDAHLGRLGHHRHLRREALRRLEDEVRLQRQVPVDDHRQGGHDLQGRQERERHVPPHRPRPGARLREGARLEQARRAVVEALELRARDHRPDPVPEAHLRRGAQRAATS